MKSGLRATMVLAGCLVIAMPAIAGTFVNGGFEDGTFNGWTQGAGYCNGYWPIIPTDFLPGGTYYNINYNASAVVTPGPDYIVGNLLNRVYNGSYAARINEGLPLWRPCRLCLSRRLWRNNSSADNTRAGHVGIAWIGQPFSQPTGCVVA